MKKEKKNLNSFYKGELIVVDYNKRLVEVSVILNHLTKSDYNKIPR